MPTPRKQSLHYSCGHPSVNTTNLPQMAPDQRPPEKMPDPFLFDSEALLRELDRCRETVLQIPITNPNATHFGIQLAVNAIYLGTISRSSWSRTSPLQTTRSW